MSVKELKLMDEVGNSINVKLGTGGFVLNIKDMNGPKNAFLANDKAHLLMLYLQEHLKC